jgi:hypothetical protein
LKRKGKKDIEIIKIIEQQITVKTRIPLIVVWPSLFTISIKVSSIFIIYSKIEFPPLSMQK